MSSTLQPTATARFQPGRSGNVSGRPRGFAGVARAIMRETGDGAELVAYALEVFRDPRRCHDQRWGALEWLANRGLGRPVTQIDLELHADPAEAQAREQRRQRMRQLTITELELLARIDGGDEAYGDLLDVDAEPAQLPAPAAHVEVSP